MSNKGKAAFDEFSAGVLAKVSDPEARRRAEEAIATLKGLDPVAQAFGDGIAGQAEIDRTLQTLRTQQESLDTLKTELDDREGRLTQWHGDLTNWYGENKTLIDEVKKGKRPAAPAGDPKSGEVPAGVLTEDAYNERITAERASFLGFSRDQNQITREHYAKFGEIVDLEPLLRHPQIGQIGLLGVYEQVHKDRLDKWKTDEQAKHDEKIGAEAVRKHQESQAQMPYPSPTGAGSGSPLDALNVGKPDALVDQATAHYQRLQAERTAVGAPAR